MPYRPEPLGNLTHEELLAYLDRELRSVGDATETVDNLQLVQLHNPPERPRDGMIVLADGTDWNPGLGAGFYGRRGGSWVLLG